VPWLQEGGQVRLVGSASMDGFVSQLIHLSSCPRALTLSVRPTRNSLTHTNTLESMHKTDILLRSRSRGTKSNKKKVKTVPLQTWTGPEGPRKLRFPDFVRTSQDGGRLSALRTGRHYPPVNTPGTLFC